MNLDKTNIFEQQQIYCSINDSNSSYITASTNKSGSPNSKNDDAKKEESKTDEKKSKKQTYARAYSILVEIKV